MRKTEFLISLLIVMYSQSYSLVSRSDSLLNLITSREFSNAIKYVEQLKTNSSWTINDKAELKTKLNNIVKFYEAYDSCESFGNNTKDTIAIFNVYKEFIKVKSAGFQFDAFSPKMGEELSKLYNRIVDKYNLLVPIVNKIVENDKIKQRKLMDSLNRVRQQAYEDERNHQQYIIDSTRADDSIKTVAATMVDSLPEIIEAEMMCEICRAFNSRKKCEGAIEEEKRYSKKYGVTNLSKIDNYKQRIIKCDRIIREKKPVYIQITKKEFQYSKCKDELIMEMELDSLRRMKYDSLSIYLANKNK